MIGKMFLSAIIAEDAVIGLLQYGAIDKLFKANEVPAYEFVKEFVKKYQKLPSADTIEAHTGETLVPHTEPSAYYFDLLQDRHTELELKRAMKDASELLKPSSKNPDQALGSLMEAVMGLVSQKYAKQVVDFRDAYGLVMADYASKLTLGGNEGLMLGWPYLDSMTGGLVVGDLISYVGRPQKGKTWQMLYGAMHGWRNDLGSNPSRLFVSMEMGVLPVEQRLASMYTHLPAKKLKDAALTTPSVKKLKAGLKEIKGKNAPFWVVDGNLAATVEDIWLLARQLNPGAIFIDGAYLVKHPTERDRYRRVAENADLMKSELAAIAPTVCSWQFAKTAVKKDKKKGEKVGLDDIGYTDAIAQVSSLVLALLEEDSVETLQSRLIEILKGRSGEVGSFRTRWDFDKMLFDEMDEKTVDDLQYL